MKMGRKERLLTYKSPLELMVVAVFSSNCAEQEARWKEITRFYEDYKIGAFRLWRSTPVPR